MDIRAGIPTVEETFVESKRDLKIPLISDIHTGALTWLENFTRDTFDGIRRHRWYWIGLGDYIEFGTKQSIGKSVYESKLNPDEQKFAFIDELAWPIRKKCIGLHGGNHDVRNKELGMTETANICRILDVPFLHDHAYHHITVNGHTWTILTTHGESNAKLPHTKIKGAYRLEEIYGGADIYAMGHVHRLEVKEEWSNKVVMHEGQQRLKRQREGTYILTGSFLDYLGSYAQTKGYHPEPAGFPILTFKKDGTMTVEKVYNPEVLME